MLPKIINEIDKNLRSTFTSIDNWFEMDSKMRKYKPSNGGWSANEILEHISLTNYFLLILIKKGYKKALKNINSLKIEEELLKFDLSYNSKKLEEVGTYNKFIWLRPSHMEPASIKTSDEIRIIIKSQLNYVLDLLHKMKNGEGLLYRTTMSVNNLGKINVYEYIIFLDKHASRHLTQLNNCLLEFNKAKL